MYLFKTENRRSTQLDRMKFEFVVIPHLMGEPTQVSQAIPIQWFFWYAARCELATYCSTESTVTDFGASLRVSLPS